MNEVELRQYIGKKIRQFRKRKNITQERLGEKLGVKNNTVSAYERGIIPLDTDTIFKLSEILEVDPSEFFPPMGEQTGKLFNRLQSLNLANMDVKHMMFLQNLIEKTLSLKGEEREKFIESIKFTVDYYNEMNKK